MSNIDNLFAPRLKIEYGRNLGAEMINKPITNNIKEKCNRLWAEMRSGNTYTLSEICRICEVKSERQARDIVSVLATKKPIISTSDSKGYRMAVKGTDLPDVEHQWRELDSRIKQLQKRIIPLIDFYEKTKWPKCGGQNE